MKLNLACGSDYRAGWLNFDCVVWPGYSPPDILWDGRYDEIPLADGVAVEVYCGYTIMHLGPQYHRRLLRDIHRVLSDNGVLVVSEVDMPVVMTRWIAEPDNQSIGELIWGEQGSIHGTEMADWDKHNWGFSMATLRALLEECGFGDFERVRLHTEAVWYELSLRCRKQRLSPQSS